MEKLSYVSLPFDLATLPDGWFSKGQINVLYQLAKRTDGPFLEVGPWIGRSTAVICHALSNRLDKVDFETVDYGISSEVEWRLLFGKDLRSKPNAHQYLPHINQPGGSIASLARNMDERGFGDLVRITRGDFHNCDLPGPYGLIFCDATHSIREIDANVPALLSKLRPGGIIACDDTHPEFEAHLRAKFKWKWAYVDSLLFYGEPA